MFFKHSFEGKNEWWKYLVGILSIFVFYLLGQMLFYGASYLMIEDKSQVITLLTEFEETMDFNVLGMSKNVGLAFLLLMFVTATIGLYFVVKYIHQKVFKKLITPNSKINYSKIFFGFGLWFFMGLVFTGLDYIYQPEVFEFRWNPGAFLGLLLLSFLLLPVQTSFEELFFRGYLMQGIVFFSKHKGIGILLSSILFGLVHGSNPEVAKYGFWTMQFYYVFAGVFLAIITVMDDSLELALGVHAATNIFGTTVLNYEGGVLQTDSLMVQTTLNPLMMTFVFIISAGIFTAICYYKYGWDYRNLFSKIDENGETLGIEDHTVID